ncbi:hypothetical protein FXO37_25722 [Capsicum annuum]|nr:hypothetical protein FXO37_25722 [Capsicum annuum]
MALLFFIFQLKELGTEGMIKEIIQYLHAAENQFSHYDTYVITPVYNTVLHSLVEAKERFASNKKGEWGNDGAEFGKKGRCRCFNAVVLIPAMEGKKKKRSMAQVRGEEINISGKGYGGGTGAGLAGIAQNGKEKAVAMAVSLVTNFWHEK